MTKKYKVTKEILAAACEKAFPLTYNCPIIRAIQAEYPKARGTKGGIFLEQDTSLYAKVDDETAKYMDNFDAIACNTTSTNRGIIMNLTMHLPEFEFELDVF